MSALIGTLSGYKTYLMAIAYGVDAAGAQMGWWAESSIRTVVEQVFTILFLRMGITASGPTK